MNVFKTSLLATALIAGGAIAPAHADESAPGYIDVTITIAKSCDITSTADVVFGTALASAGTVTAQGGVTIQCTVATPYDVALNAGNNSGGGGITARQMLHTNSTDSIAYQLYQDSARGIEWGETDGTNTVTGTGVGFSDTDASFDQVYNVYAEATIVGTEPTGDYSDIITATVTF